MRKARPSDDFAELPIPCPAIPPKVKTHLLDVETLLDDQVIVLEADLAVSGGVDVRLRDGDEGLVEAGHVLLDAGGKPVE